MLAIDGVRAGLAIRLTCGSSGCPSTASEPCKRPPPRDLPWLYGVARRVVSQRPARRPHWPRPQCSPGWPRPPPRWRPFSGRAVHLHRDRGTGRQRRLGVPDSEGPRLPAPPPRPRRHCAKCWPRERGRRATSAASNGSTPKPPGRTCAASADPGVVGQDDRAQRPPRSATVSGPQANLGRGRSALFACPHLVPTSPRDTRRITVIPDPPGCHPA